MSFRQQYNANLESDCGECCGEDEDKQKDLRGRCEDTLICLLTSVKSLKLNECTHGIHQQKGQKWQSIFHLDHHTWSLVVRCGVHVGAVTDGGPWEDREGLGGEDDDDVCEGWDEGDDPDQSDESVGSLHGADLDVTQRLTNSNVTLHCHASQVQRAVPGQRKTKTHKIWFVCWNLQKILKEHGHQC